MLDQVKKNFQEWIFYIYLFREISERPSEPEISRFKLDQREQVIFVYQ